MDNLLVAVIPSVGASPLLGDLVHTCREVTDSVVVPVNRSESLLDVLELVPDGAVTLSYPGRTLYQVWNETLDQHAADPAGSVLLFLNDDVRTTPQAVALVATTLRDNPEYGILGFDYGRERGAVGTVRECFGSYRTGGVGGFAFAVRSDLPARVDERFVWWGGDDDLFLKTLNSGLKIGVVSGATVRHDHPGTSSAKHPGVLRAITNDREVFVELWGEALAW